jgi:hypothetical protein
MTSKIGENRNIRTWADWVKAEENGKVTYCCSDYLA